MKNFQKQPDNEGKPKDLIFVVIGVVSVILGYWSISEVAASFENVNNTHFYFLCLVGVVSFFISSFCLYNLMFGVDSKLAELKRIYNKDWDDNVDVCDETVRIVRDLNNQ